MNRRLKKILLLLLAAALLFGTSRMQHELNRDRSRLGLTHLDQPLENAPPALAFTTMALGGFRGLISNWLWMRASQLQEDDKFFEMVQLTDWITKMEPHFEQVWVHEGWNMAFNISVKFKDYKDRWRWVQRGVELLRDEGLRYNPDSVLIHRELAWFFQFKLGADLDDASRYYKTQWKDEMTEVFGQAEPNFDELINPQTDSARRRQFILTNRFKLDPVFMKGVHDRHGALEWRLPEAHAIYWAELGLEKARLHPDKINGEDLLQLRRVVYQSMQLAFQRGRVEINPFNPAGFEYGPNLDIVPNTDAAYRQEMDADPKSREHIKVAHRNFLRQAVYALYVHNRMPEAVKWFRVLAEEYPDKPIVDEVPDSFPRNLTLDQYAVACVQTDVSETSHDRVKAAIEGLLVSGYRSMILDQDDRAAGFRLLANKIWETYRGKIPQDRWPAIGIPPIQETSEIVLDAMLNPTNGVPPEARAILRTKLRMGPETAPTNAPPAEAPK